jgi:hypothetical protein
VVLVEEAQVLVLMVLLAATVAFLFIIKTRR